MIKKNIKNLGFTFIEIMVTVTIIALLTSIAIASYADAAKSGRDGKRKADIEAIRQALVVRRADEGNYPSPNMGDVQTGLAGYISDPFPTDSKAPGRSYTYYSDGSNFCLCAYLESENKGNSTAQAASPSVTCSFNGVGNKNYYCATNP